MAVPLQTRDECTLWRSRAGTYLETLLDLFDKHVSVRCKAIHRENCTICPIQGVSNCGLR